MEQFNKSPLLNNKQTVSAKKKQISYSLVKEILISSKLSEIKNLWQSCFGSEFLQEKKQKFSNHFISKI